MPEDFSTPEPILGRESYDLHPQDRVGTTAIESRDVGEGMGSAPKQKEQCVQTHHCPPMNADLNLLTPSSCDFPCLPP